MKPLVSVIIPHIWNRSLICIEPIKEQTYKNIEIIVIVDNDLEGPAKSRNAGAAMARGELLFFCDDDIRPKPDCIEKMVAALDADPEIDFAYCDYDKSGALEGIERSHEWDTDFLKKRNYISTMSLIRKSSFPGFDESLERYLDWDLWLTIAAAGGRGAYIPEVLFSAHFGSSGISLRGPADRLRQTEILKNKHGINDRSYSIIVPVHNEVEQTRNCIESLLKFTGDDFELIIVDDNSTDETAEYLERVEGYATIIRNKKQKHHSFCCNQGIKVARGEYIILLNNDTLVTLNWNVKLKRAFESVSNCSCIGPLTSCAASCQELRMFREVKDSINRFNVQGIQDRVDSFFRKDPIRAKITGFCFFTTKKMFKSVGYFDEKIPAGGNEGEWIIRASGLFPYIAPGVYVHHFGAASYSKEDRSSLWKTGKDRILKKYGGAALHWLERRMYLDLYDDFENDIIKTEERE